METGENNIITAKQNLLINQFQVKQNFTHTQATACLLALEVSNNKLLCTILDKNTASIIGVGAFDFLNEIELRQILNTQQLFKFSYAAVVGVDLNMSYSLIPKAIFDKSIAQNYLNFAGKNKSNHLVKWHKLQLEEAVVVYSNNFEQFKVIEQHFQHIFCVPHVAVEIDLHGINNKYCEGFSVEIFLHQSFFDLLISKNGKLQFFNSFNAEAYEDVVYYTLFTLEQLNINSVKTTLNVSGNCAFKNELLKQFSKYVYQVNKPNQSNLVTFNKDVELSLINNFYSLIHAFLCV